MKLTDIAISKLTQETRLRLAIALKYSEFWVNRLVEQNKDNGPLTLAKALEVIRENTGLTDAEILEDVKVAS